MKALLRQALDALVRETYGESNSTYKVIDALRAALTALVEPVAHMYPSDLEKFETNETYAYAYSVAVGNPDERSVPLYAAPQPAPAVPDDAALREINTSLCRKSNGYVIENARLAEHVRVLREALHSIAWGRAPGQTSKMVEMLEAKALAALEKTA